MSNNNFFIGDLFYKIKERFYDYLRLCRWKILIGKIGKNSKIKSGVMISGNPKRISIGDNFKVWHRCFFGVGNGRITIGNNGHLGVDVYINASEGNIIIGDYVAIAPKTQIYSYTDHFDRGSKIGELHRTGDVRIENNVLIGSGVIILPGVTINEGSVIGAGAVVTKDVSPYTIVAGVPAREIRKR